MTTNITTAFVARVMRERGYAVVEGPDTPISGGAADSRAAQPGDLFGAFPGENVDGNAYVAAALENGAVAAVCERPPTAVPAGKTLVVAPNTTRAMGELAHAWLKECGTRVVAITGTVGKSTAKDMAAAVLASRYRVHKSPGNFNSREGLPLAVMSLAREDEVSVLEFAMDSPGEILELCTIAEPSVGVVLNIGLTHVSKLGSIEAIANEKLSLPRYLPPTGTAVLNTDDHRIAAVVPELRCATITFGSDASEPRPLLRVSNIRSRGLDGMRFTVTHATDPIEVQSPLPGEHTIASVVAAIGAGIACGLTLRGAAKAVAASGIGGRARKLRGKNGSAIIDDRYNSSPASLAGALALLGELKGRRIALIGRMAELGEHEEAEHRAIGRLAASNCDVLAAVGEPCRALVDEAKSAGHAAAHWFEDKDAAAAFVAAQLGENDIVLLKASRSQAFETLIPLLEAGP